MITDSPAAEFLIIFLIGFLASAIAIVMAFGVGYAIHLIFKRWSVLERVWRDVLFMVLIVMTIFLSYCVGRAIINSSKEQAKWQTEPEPSPPPIIIKHKPRPQNEDEF